MTKNGKPKRSAQEQWQLTKEKLMMGCGLGIIIHQSVIAELIGAGFHFEILLAGLALCGVSIATWGDKR